MHFEGEDAHELVHAGQRMVVVTSIGPRISWFGYVGGRNLLYWDTAGKKQRAEWRLRGGHRLWLTRPGADESEETYDPDNAACRVREVVAGLRVIALPTHARIEKTLTVRASGPGWRISHRIRNVGDMLWAGGIWALTCTSPERSTRYRIPLDGGSSDWDALTVVIPRRWGGGHSSRVEDSQLRLAEDALHIRASGREAKRMLRTARGALEMHDSRGHFTKSARPIAGGAYPLDTNVAVYLAPRAFMVELETMGPASTLAPGTSVDHDELWSLTR